MKNKKNYCLHHIRLHFDYYLLFYGMYYGMFWLGSFIDCWNYDRCNELFGVILKLFEPL